jgi:hypothetical protein
MARVIVFPGAAFPEPKRPDPHSRKNVMLPDLSDGVVLVDEAGSRWSLHIVPLPSKK